MSCRLLSLDLGVGLDSNVVVALEGVDFVRGEVGTARIRQLSVHDGREAVKPYVKPLIRVNSLVILPPWSVTFFFAFSSSSAEAPELRVT